MNYYKNFQDRMKQEKLQNGLANAQFVFSAENSTILCDSSNGENIVHASVVNLQEKDLAYIYTNELDVLPIGSVWSAKNLSWLIAEEIVIIKHVKWHKYLAFKCNVLIDNIYGYFKGPQKQFINVTLQQNTVLQSLQHPVLVLSNNKTFNINDKIMINNRGWLIQEKDDISTNGITYYSLRETTINKQELNKTNSNIVPNQSVITLMPSENPIQTPSGEILIGAGSTITLNTEQGYFRTNNPLVQISTMSATTVTFIIPYGISSLEVKTKESGEIVTRKYKVEN